MFLDDTAPCNWKQFDDLLTFLQDGSSMDEDYIAPLYAVIVGLSRWNFGDEDRQYPIQGK